MDIKDEGDQVASPVDADKRTKSGRRVRRAASMRHYHFGSSDEEDTCDGDDEGGEVDEGDSINGGEIEEQPDVEDNEGEDQGEMSAYEKRRLQQIRENQEMMRALGIGQAQTSLNRGIKREKKLSKKEKARGQEATETQGKAQSWRG